MSVQRWADRTLFEPDQERDLFYYLMHHDEYPQVRPAAYARISAALKRAHGALEGYCLPADHRLTEHLKKIAEAAPQVYIGSFTRAQCVQILQQFAPLALLEGCWLQKISQAATAHTEVCAQLFRVYSRIMGEGQPSRHMGNLYRSLLEQLDIRLPAINSYSFGCQLYNQAALEAAILQLSLAQFPRIYLAEIIGFTLAHGYGVSHGYRLLTIDACRKFNIPPSYFKWHGASSYLAELSDSSERALQLYLQGCGKAENLQQKRRILAGFLLYKQLADEFCWRLERELVKKNPLQEQVVAIFKRKAPYACGHHATLKMGHKNLDDWFCAENFDAEGFLDVFIRSPYVDRQNPLKSRFLTEIISFGGPMFGIFTEAEIALLRRWLESLRDDAAALPRGSGARLSRPVEMKGKREKRYPSFEGALKEDRALTQRELFHYLVNVDLYPNCLAQAKKHVLKVLKKAGRFKPLKAFSRPRFFPYSYHAFASYIADRYVREMQAYKPFEPPPKLDKAVYVWAIEQFSPTVLVDGCWLQNIAGVGSEHTEVAALLFKIYADEVGNGQAPRNHANVYRTLLKSLHIDLPPIDSYEFAAYPGFLDSAFDLPVFLLAISQFPKSFLPEIIGLNLAIELSGLGKTYMRLVDELTYWGIDPYIVRLHISIDNLDSGHAAMAKEAVTLYLDRILATCGFEEMQNHWKRIWRGHLALQVAARRFGYALVWRYFSRFALGKKNRNSLGTFLDRSL